MLGKVVHVAKKKPKEFALGAAVLVVLVMLIDDVAILGLAAYTASKDKTT